MAEFSRTWWGQRFLTALERFTDPARLGRGRSYARGGKVKEYALDGSTVRAKVRGSINPYYGIYKEPLYTTTIAIKPIAPEAWEQAIAQLSSRASHVAKLLMGEMPDNIDEVFAQFGVHLLPHRQNEFTTQCSCPDWANPCKHIAGVYYLLAADLDRDPFLLFELRGLSREKLRQSLAASPLGQALAAGMTAPDVPIEPAESYYTAPRTTEKPATTYRGFWMGSKRLPPFKPPPAPTVPALLVKKHGDYPAFWHRDNSFIEAMEELYERVRRRSEYLK